jgi:hypothetical protein
MRCGNRAGSRPVDIQRARESVVVRVENTQPRWAGEPSKELLLLRTTALPQSQMQITEVRGRE